jgi:hypothetical protein
MRVGANLRGVEATAIGTLTRREGKLLFDIAGTGEVVPLAALGKPVQWDVAAKRVATPTEAELDAFRRLVEAREPPGRIRVIGPLRLIEGSLTLEVREFTLSP